MSKSVEEFARRLGVAWFEFPHFGASPPGLPLAKIAKIPSQSPAREAILFRQSRIK